MVRGEYFYLTMDALERGLIGMKGTMRPFMLAGALMAWIAPAYADLSCHDFLRGVVLGDPDVLRQAADLELPLVQATVREIDNKETDAKGISIAVQMEVVDFCRALPDDTVGSIVATRVKVVNAAIEAAQRQAAEEAAAKKEAAKIAAEAEANPALDKHFPTQILISPNEAALSADQRGAISDHALGCWTTDPGMLDLDRMQVLLTVTTDVAGVARQAVVAPEDEGRVAGDMRLRVFAERAVRAVLDPHCANLPLPQDMLGKTNVVTFRFSP